MACLALTRIGRIAVIARIDRIACIALIERILSVGSVVSYLTQRAETVRRGRRRVVIRFTPVASGMLELARVSISTSALLKESADNHDGLHSLAVIKRLKTCDAATFFSDQKDLSEALAVLLYVAAFGKGVRVSLGLAAAVAPAEE